MNYKAEIKKKILKLYGHDPRSLDELAECTIKVINEKARVAGLAWEIRHGTVSNTHSCPINGVENWGERHKDRPTGYPGWNGRVWIRYAEINKGFGSDPFRETLTYPGTGGWGAYSGPWASLSSKWFNRFKFDRKKAYYPEPQIYSWDYRFYDSDWPDLDYYNLFDMINTGSKRNKHYYIWEDEEIRNQDKEFVNTVSEETV